MKKRKRILCLMLTFFMTLSMILSGGMAALDVKAADSGLIQNGNFESVTDGSFSNWTGITADNVVTEDNCLKVTYIPATDTATAVTQTAAQTVEVVGGATYKLSFLFKTSDGVRPLVKLTEKDASGADVDNGLNTHVDMVKGETNGGWTAYSYEFTTKDSTASLIVRLRANKVNEPTSNLVSYYDNVCLERVGILANGDFSALDETTGLYTGWNGVAEGNVQKDSNCLKLTYAETTIDGMATINILNDNISSGQTYRVTFRHKGSSDSVIPYVFIADDVPKTDTAERSYLSKTYDSVNKFSVVSEKATDGWTTYTLDYTAQKGAKYFYIKLRRAAVTGVTNPTSWYDDVYMYKLVEGEVTGSNLLVAKNPDFELVDSSTGKFTSWSNVQASYSELSSNNLKLTATQSVSQTFAVAGNSNYTLTLRHKGENGALPTAKLIGKDSAGNEVQNTDITFTQGTTDASGTWTGYSADLVVNESVEQAVLQLTGGAGSESTGISYYDDIALISSDNLVSNPSFTEEANGTLTGWTAEPAYEISGNNSLKLTYITTTAEMQTAAQTVEVTGGSTYQLTLLYKSDVEGLAPLVKLTEKDAAGSETTGFDDHISMTAGDTTDGWTSYSHTFTVDRDTAKVIIRLRSRDKSGETDPVSYYDNVCLVKTVNEADMEEFIQNGNFEKVTSAGNFMVWGTGTGVSVDNGAGMDESTAIKLDCASAASVSVMQRINNIDDENTYTLTFWHKGSDTTIPPVVKLDYIDTNGTYFSNITLDTKAKFNAVETSGEWTKYSYEIAPPEGTVAIAVRIRGQKQGTVSWYDNVSVMGVPSAGYEVKAPYENAPELLLNGSWENGISETGVAEWEFNENTASWWGNEVSIDTTTVYAGTNSLKISTTKENQYPWIRQWVEGVSGLTEYQLSFWYNSENIGDRGLAFKVEFYDENGESIVEKDENGNLLKSYDLITPYLFDSHGKWKQSGALFTTPEGTAYLRVYARLYGTGTVWFDGASLYRTSAVPRGSMSTDWSIFYPDMNEGTITFYPNFKEHTNLTGGSAELRLLDTDGTTVLATSGQMAMNQESLSFTFSTESMDERAVAYTVQTLIRTEQNGEVVETLSNKIYRFDYPTYLNENGTFTMDGEEEVPVLGYHVGSAEEYKLAAAAGANVLQVVPTDAAHLQRILDNCVENNVKAMVVLYRNMMPAGEATNIERTKELVEAGKDHEGLLGWLLADEPSAYLRDSYDVLVDSYVAVRSIDTVHPTFIQCQEGASHAKEYAGACDILITHSYPVRRSKIDIVGSVTQMITRVNNALNKDSFPVWFLGQSFGDDRTESVSNWSEGYILPNIAEYRKIFYAAVQQKHFSGLGIYSFSETNWALYDEALYDGMVAFAANEQPIMEKAYITKEYIKLSGDRTDEVWWDIFRDGEDMYLFATNAAVGKTVNVNIPLNSQNRTTQATSFSGTRIGGEGADTINGTNSVTLTIAADDVLVYKITTMTVEPTPTPTVEPTPTPTVAPTPTPTAEPTPTTKPVATAEPTAEPTPTTEPIEPESSAESEDLTEETAEINDLMVSPETGDNSNLLFWAALVLICGLPFGITKKKASK